MRPSVALPALVSGEIEYVGGIGPGSVSATLGGFPVRGVWFSTNRTGYWLMARPQFRSLQDLQSRKIGLSGLGGTNHVALMMALEKVSANPRDFTFVAIPAPQLLQSLESGFVDAVL